VGHYDFQPGQEMQHDTSPHRASIAGVEQRIETASLVLCYSRMLFCQAYPAFTRFYCKVFLTDALTYLGAAAATCLIDNTHVVVASGTGARMVPAPEMAAFADRFHFTFRAHEKGDANRSARVERPFHFIEHNFLAGRTFVDLADLNAQARAWCDKVNATYKDDLHASPRELFAAERPHLQPLPLFIPEVYALHHRLVDVEGYVNVHGHRYSVPYLLIGRQQRAAGRGTLALRRLLTLSREYPRAAVHQAVTLALQYGLFDLDRLERLTLRVIAKEYFRLVDQEEE
jgi:hypothetical protein